MLQKFSSSSCIILLWFTPKRMARSSCSGEKLCLSSHKVNSIAHPLAPVSFSFPLLSCPSKVDVSSSKVCWHNSFAESPTRCNKNSIHSTLMPNVIKSGGCSSLVYSKVCDFLVLLSWSDGSRSHKQHSTIVLRSTTFFSPHEIFTDSHRACLKLPDSNFQCLDVVLNVAFQRDRIFLFISCLWRFVVCQLPCWCSHQPPSLLRPGILPGWRDSTAVFSQA